MKFTFVNTGYKFRDGRYLHHPKIELHANGLFEAMELLKLMVSDFSQWELA